MNYRIIFLLVLFGSCQNLSPNDERFMEECDCYVSTNEITKQHRKGYSIEFINKAKSSGCARKQLKYTSIVKFIDSLGLESVVIKSKHPEHLIRQVKKWSITFHTETMCLTHVVDHGKKVQLTLGKKYENIIDSTFNNTYRPIYKIQMQEQKRQWVEVKRIKNEYWPWQNPTSW